MSRLTNDVSPVKDRVEVKAKTGKEETVDLIGCSMVAYTDGGCRPSSRGYAGYGIHGYFYVDGASKAGTGCKLYMTTEGYKLEKVDIVTSITVLSYIDQWAPIVGEGTNNIAELEAVIATFDIALDLKVKRLRILADSEYVIKGIRKYLVNWVARGWMNSEGKYISNIDQWRRIHTLIEELNANGCDFDINHVAGHSGDLGNDLADDHATRGVILRMHHNDNIAKTNVELSKASGYWSPKVNTNRLLGKSAWYFSSDPREETYLTDDGRYVYLMGSHGPEDKLLGKRTSDSSYSVAYLKEKDVILEAVRKRQVELSDVSNVVIGYHDKIKRPNVFSDISKYGGIYLITDSKTAKSSTDLITASNVRITKEMRTPGLAWRAIDTLQSLDDRLDSFVKNKDALLEGSLSNNYAFDITDTIYLTEVNKKGKTVMSLRKDITQQDKYINFECKLDDNQLTTKLLFDMDLPSRNVLSALASDNNVKVYALVWLDGNAYRYVTVVENMEDIAIFSSVYSNYKMIIK